MGHPTRVTPVDHANLTPRQQQVGIKMGRFGAPDASNLMRTLLNYPEFARSIGRMSSRVTLTSDLPERLYQLACMRTVWLCDCEYLWATHRAECLDLGVTDAELTAVANGSDALSGDDRLIVETIDQMHNVHYLFDDKWRWLEGFGPNAVADMMTTYGFYVTMSAFANSAGVTLDDRLTGFDETLEPLRNTAPAPHGLDPMKSYPKRVQEADYARLSPAQREQTNRMGRRGLPTTSKLQKAMINYVEFLKALSPFGKRAIDNTSLPGRVWQLACMRTVWLCDSEYLWSQHRMAILQLGVTDEDLRGVAEGPDSPLLKGFDPVVVRSVDELYYENRLSDANWSQFDQFGSEGVTDLILVYGLYVIQAILARSFGTTLEEGKQGYAPELAPLRDRQQR